MKSSKPDLWSLTYTSAAARLPTRAELERLMVRARARNQREAITGVLLYYNGSFLQCLEGPEANLQRVYAAICADPLHRRVTELVREPITQREYREWSMALCFISGDPRGQGDELLLRRLAPTEDDTSASRRLMRTLAFPFWSEPQLEAAFTLLDAMLQRARLLEFSWAPAPGATRWLVDALTGSLTRG